MSSEQYDTLQNSDDYSASSTITTFNPPLPLLRSHHPSSDGSHILAFKSPRSFLTAFSSTLAKLTSQCESGARIGCSLSASQKCTPPWYKQFFLFGSSISEDFKEREECEAREMEACFSIAKEKCVTYAKEKCVGAFGEVRVKKERRSSKCLNEATYCKGSELLNLEDGIGK